jgi:hypothetical protein
VPDPSTDSVPAQAPARTPKYSRRGYDPLLKYLRFVKGGRVQVRIPIEPTGRVHLSLGCYPNVPSAVQVRNQYARTGKRPPHLLPRWVRFSGGGRRARPRGFYADVRIPGAQASFGPFKTADAAHRAAVKHLLDRLGRAMAQAYLIGVDPERG